MHTENHKLMKETRDDTSKWKDIYVHELKYLVLLRCHDYSKLSAVSMQSMKIPTFFAEAEKPILKSTWNLKGP